MRVQYFLLLVLLITGCAVKMIMPEDRLYLDFYFHKSSYIYKKFNDQRAYTRILQHGDDFLIIDNVFSAESNEVIRKSVKVYGVRYKDENYLNMGYSDDYTQFGIFAKYDIEGKICALFIDDDTSKKVKSGGNDKYGVNLNGYISVKIEKWGNNWTKADGKKGKIIVLNAMDPKEYSTEKFNLDRAKLLTKKNFNELLFTHFTKDEINGFNFEDVVSIIEKFNLQ